MKKKTKSMGPKQILAYIAFIIAVVWTLKFVFELSSSSVKQISGSKVTSSSSGKYPILKCTVEHSGETIVKVHDLNIQNLNRKIGENYIEWRTVPGDDGSGELTIIDHSADRRTGTYITKMTIMKSGQKDRTYTFTGICETGSNEKLF